MRPYVVAFLDRVLFPGAGDVLAPSYLVMLCLALLVGAALISRRAAEAGFEQRRSLGVLAWVWLGAILGAALMPVVVQSIEWSLENRGVLVLRGGLAAYGGFLGGALAGYLALGPNRGDFLRFGDLAAPSLGIGTALTRLGCFLAGCDFGVVANVPWGVRFPPSSPAFHAHAEAGLVGPYSAASLPVHPTELYESVLGLAMFGMATLMLDTPTKDGATKPPPGAVFLSTVALYAAGRGAIEVLRGDVDRGMFGGISTSQIISAVVLSAVGFASWRRRLSLQ